MVLVRTAFVTAGLLFTTAIALSKAPAATFVANDSSISFALNIPQDDNSNELFFSISGDSSLSWLAIGMGSEKMDDSLMFMLYSDPSGKNGKSNHASLAAFFQEKPPANSWTSNCQSATVSRSCGTQLYLECFLVRFLGSWKGGSIDPKNTAAKFIYATGPDGNLNTKSLTASIKRHATYGAFTMDLTKAVGAGSVPVPAVADSAGVKQTKDKTDHDFSAPLHACIMILAFFGLMPIGILILRVMDSPKWHGINQALSAVVALIGACVGIYAGTMFNRTKKFNSAHQILGLMVMVLMIGQFVLGFMHHRMYTKTQAPTKFAPIHVWLGRVVIAAGIVNGFLGFPLALNPKYNWALLALVLLVIIFIGPLAFWRYKRNVQKAKTEAAVGPAGYQNQPWMNTQSDLHLHPMNPPPVYQNPGYGR
ncbi:hypothetical protein LOCC1_G001634 [Lachnellula occidentalis]|uniref:Cytochrome b561 domain-containing protein n=1 Tax=Lachnellula occidentalis TaxID=215460 RepID=A0A8H8S4R2_9HELO|nr:hypothetical protein LOCC1_G001634 [Lachnellula occidentalis]